MAKDTTLGAGAVPDYGHLHLLRRFLQAVETGEPGYVSNAPPATTGCFEASVIARTNNGMSLSQAETIASDATDKAACEAADVNTCETIDSAAEGAAAGTKACAWVSSKGNCFETATTSVAADLAACNAINTDDDLLPTATACRDVKTAASVAAGNTDAPQCNEGRRTGGSAGGCAARIAATLGETTNESIASRTRTVSS